MRHDAGKCFQFPIIIICIEVKIQRFFCSSKPIAHVLKLSTYMYKGLSRRGVLNHLSKSTNMIGTILYELREHL